ncbi:hypothetical protein PICMEDRAFT_87175 [Pichia membranifaciens NRRL Y-2026]|uniref:Uncharacterized protein n=1 Tax=Pichia membranifaciens NRRL Y-2026 TaxID=763406 RepID=A0A1E3NRT8_9ASCO|nr:hypothetical protein PICMEDRAFT_87175 [Pichia membranifaciens NRRL Y-2026]ODQ48800.1 hypothetical protein PICMEDRAFT_87175 [Pichia membranifaciens NRRL Y-2026]
MPGKSRKTLHRRLAVAAPTRSSTVKLLRYPRVTCVMLAAAYAEKMDCGSAGITVQNCRRTDVSTPCGKSSI